MKRILAQGVAHLSFPGGGVFLPARNPYDWQLLTEHVAHRVRVSGQAQVLVNDQRWMVYLKLDREALGCSVCGSLSDLACHLPSTDRVSFCVTCAFSDRLKSQRRSSASAGGGAKKRTPDTRRFALDAATLRRGPRHSRRFIEASANTSQAPGSGSPTRTPYTPAVESDGYVHRRDTVAR